MEQVKSQNQVKHHWDVGLDFDSGLTSLISICISVLEKHRDNNIMASDTVLKRLRKYQRCYDKSEEEDRGSHAWPFKDIFERHKTRILNGDDSWIAKTSLCVQYGARLGASNDIKIHLSSIYKIASKERSSAMVKYKNASDEVYSSHEEIIYPDVMLACLYKIFRELSDVSVYDKEYIATGEEIGKLDKIISNLESRAGISKKEKLSGDGLEGILDMAKGALQKMGMEVPEDIPRGDELHGAISRLLNDEQTTSIISGIVSSVKDGTDMGDIVSKIASGFGDQALADSISKSIPDTMRGIGKEDKGKEQVSGDEGDDEFLD